MIISHRFKFIFVKTFKTAGTSLEAYLSSVCGESDVFTPIFPPHPDHAPRNHDGFYNHMSAAEIRARVGQDIWQNYTTFCVVRNPWEKTISHFWMLKKSQLHQGERGEDLSFDEYLRSDRHCVDHQLYTDPADGSVMVDHVLRYEELDTQLAGLLARLGVPFEGKLTTRAKSEFREDRTHYRCVLTSSQAAHIADQHRRALDLHCYRF